jgi:hypothetical protein
LALDELASTFDRGPVIVWANVVQGSAIVCQVVSSAHVHNEARLGLMLVEKGAVAVPDPLFKRLVQAKQILEMSLVGLEKPFRLKVPVQNARNGRNGPVFHAYFLVSVDALFDSLPQKCIVDGEMRKGVRPRGPVRSALSAERRVCNQ